MIMSSVCFITAIYGDYESSCKRFVSQTIDTDFICFTDNKDIINNGWTIDTTPYHLINKSKLDDDTYVNSLCNNKHTFNTCKYYKQAFRNIPTLKKYDVIVWIDGTIEITYNRTSEYVLENIHSEKIIGWNNCKRRGNIKFEVKGSHTDKYTSTHWNGQSQPFQDVDHQYKCYLEDGYNQQFYKKCDIGVWITCFVAFLQKDEMVEQFLDLWYLQTLKYTTQDQISFSYVVQKQNILPLTLPNKKIHGRKPHRCTMFYKKHNHQLPHICVQDTKMYEDLNTLVSKNCRQDDQVFISKKFHDELGFPNTMTN